MQSPHLLPALQLPHLGAGWHCSHAITLGRRHKRGSQGNRATTTSPTGVFPTETLHVPDILDSHMWLPWDDNKELLHTLASAACWGRVSKRPAGSCGRRTLQPPVRCSLADCSQVTASSRSGSKARNLFQRYCCCSGSFNFL